MTPITAYAFSFAALGGGRLPLLITRQTDRRRQNRVLVRLYPQYAGSKNSSCAFTSAGGDDRRVPSNDFGGQEPGGPAEITQTANKEYASLPAHRQGRGQGPERASVLQMGAGERPRETPKWNFHKYLVGRDGHIAAVFATEIEPMDARVVDAVAKELGRAE